MRKLIKIELRKAITSRSFIIVLAIAFLIAVICAAYNIQFIEQEQRYYEKAVTVTGEGMNPDLPAYGLYNHWICQDFTSFSASLFWVLFPAFAAISYGWSFFTERKTGYIKNIITRTEKSQYYWAKYITTFIAGGLAVTVPVLINLIICAMYLPAVRPDIFYDINYGVYMPSMFSEIFYRTPLLYVLLRVLIVFLYSGGAAVISFTLAFIVPNRIAVVLLPFIICIGLHYTGSLMLPGSFNIELSPIYIVGSNGIRFRRLWVVLLEPIVSILISLTVCLYKGKKEDVL